MESLFITGYSEASASYTYSRVGERYNIYFAIKFSWKDEYLAVAFMDFFGVGKLYPLYGRGGELKSFYYRVNKLDDLNVIVAHYDNYPLLGEKKERYLKWREMYLIKRGIIDGVDIGEVARELSAMNPKK